MGDWRAALDARPRVRLAPLPTPLTPAPRLGEALGIDLWLKRDDIGSPGLAGNKVRKLEFALGEALADGVDTVVTLGAEQSNHCRATAAACAQLGLDAHLLFLGDPPAPPPGGNLLLDRLFGAVVHYTGATEWIALGEPLASLVDELREAGRTPVVLPAGCSSPVGALGFVAAYVELLDQLDAAGLEPERVLHASTSGGTHAGLVLGHALAGRGPRPLGLEVGHLFDGVPGLIAGLATGAAELLGADRAVTVEELDLPEDQLGDGYGAFTPAATEAIRLAARTEGLVFDPVYSGKGLAGLVARARAGELGGGPVVFWHTGGAPSLFAGGWADDLL